ncbi:MAG: TRAP transporter small permease subunit [Xanthomonadales bacterium]|nr:TRAP transporter small permease subunit [Xanthomonadales bacterium]
MTAESARQRLAHRLEAPLRALGWLCGACVLAVVLVTFALVALRYGAGRGSIAAQELVLHLNAVAFMLGGAWTLLRDGHVRVDVLQQRWSPRTRARVELAGLLLLLLPFCAVLFWTSLDYVAASWRLREASREVGGLPGLYLIKALIPLSALLLAMAGLARGLRLDFSADRGGDPAVPAA